MKKILILCAIIIAGCKEEKPVRDLSYLTGYWEITEVYDANGIQKSYLANTTVDYILWDGDAGYRKKLQPTLMGTYRTSDDAINFSLEQVQDQILLTFKGATEIWQEEISVVGPQELILVHATGQRFHYKRYQPLITLEDVQED